MDPFLRGLFIQLALMDSRTGPLMHHYEGSYNLQEQLWSVVAQLLCKELSASREDNSRICAKVNPKSSISCSCLAQTAFPRLLCQSKFMPHFM
ncbi:hypothetical protein H5410_037819 [Solanum commersonii]|uniref:Uncharacterized protein n=1 Tax=Solanum commersonii TaxID=4109 RepID=A0A9J5Y7C1_SOLCO|nr:hypothetical protein H5410_037819 [Solanum commersonii]